MTDPTDETQPHPTAPRGPGSAAQPAGLAHDDGPGSAADPGPAPAPESAPAAPAGVDSGLRVDPNRPADSGWREPAWIPPRERDRKPSMAAIVFGLVLIALGAWFFVDRTLGVDLPRIQWGTLWPVILIVIGGVILLRAFKRPA